LKRERKESFEKKTTGLREREMRERRVVVNYSSGGGGRCFRGKEKAFGAKLEQVWEEASHKALRSKTGKLRKGRRTSPSRARRGGGRMVQKRFIELSRDAAIKKRNRSGRGATKKQTSGRGTEGHFFSV